MTFEVEQKFWVDDLDAVKQRLQQYDANWCDPIEQVDSYFAHPSRDFAQTDEALRIRQVGDENCITYKGPKLDAATKTRREIELPLQLGTAQAASWSEMLQALGFRPVSEVRKSRERATLRWQDKQVEIALDTINNLGTFVELEITAEEEQLDEARASVLALADALALTRTERRSYLEMLMPSS